MADTNVTAVARKLYLRPTLTRREKLARITSKPEITASAEDT
ncbi:MAG: hypothetical protein WD871_13260 [Xanthobacteraceae bacterium]